MKITIKALLIGACFSVCFSWQLLAKELKMGIGLALPPYIIKDHQEAKGFEYEVVKEALAKKGYKVKPRFLPFGRLTAKGVFKKIDGVLTTNEASGLKNIHYSDSHVTYQNVAITLKKNNKNINSIADLGQGTVLAFQNATKYLGETYKRVVSKNKGYREIADQEAQVARLFMGKTDALVGDINIFKYFRMNTKRSDTSAPIRIHKIFSPVHYKVGFVDIKVRDDFNSGLKSLRESGAYEKIVARYIK